MIFHATSDSCSFSGCTSVWPKERSNFAGSLQELIVLPSCEASPFPKDRSKQSFIPEAVQTHRSGVFQETFHSKCPSPPQSDARTAPSSGVQQPQDTAKVPASTSPRTGSSCHVPAVLGYRSTQLGTAQSNLFCLRVSSHLVPAQTRQSSHIPSSAGIQQDACCDASSAHRITPHPLGNTSKTAWLVPGCFFKTNLNINTAQLLLSCLKRSPNTT